MREVYHNHSRSGNILVTRSLSLGSDPPDRLLSLGSDPPDRREVVFTELRKQGIKAIKVVAADGTKANGEVRGVRKRVVTVGALCLVLCALCGIVAAFWLGRGRSPSAPQSENPTIQQSNNSPTAPRHQIYGDPVVMAAFEQGDFADVFDEPGDQLLAWYAQPGKLMCPLNANTAVCTEKMASNLLAVASKKTGGESRSTVALSPADSREVRELKQIVNGMREELRSYLANGNGTVYSYWRRLNERLSEEQQIYERTKRELDADPSPALRAERNAALRNLGLRTIPAPKKEAARKSQ